MKLFSLQNAKRKALLLVMLFMASLGGAVPAKPGLTRTLTRTDGTTITARLVGDEHGHYWIGQDGKAYLVGSEGIATAVDAEAIKTKASVRRQKVNAQRAKRLAPRRVGDVGNYTGQKKGLIILVNFTDTTFKAANNNALYQRIANEENFSYGDFVGSMYDYFKAQSDGQFLLNFDVVGPVTVSKAQSYYGGNDSSGNDLYPATMVIEALKLADSQVNYADYDWDGDGEVEQVYVVYAGQGEADGGIDDTIWPHEWTLASAKSYGDGAGAQTLDGVKIDTYACGGELNGSGNIAGIGTMCHEFSHCLGYPDFYDTDYSGGQGMGYWDLMDSGSYNDDGYRPAGYTSYERWVAGWATPTELTTTQQVSNMPNLQSSGQSYVIYNPGNSNEYFLLENRQKTGWDAGVPGEGLLILHVDYDATVWSNNEPNDDPSHQRMTWIPADNQYQYTTYQNTKYYSFSGMANDPFPYGTVNAFSASTTPAAKFYNTNTNDNTYYLDSSIENITQNSDGTVSFKFVGLSNVATPTFSPAAGRYSEAQTVSITCTTDGATIYYTLDGTTPTTSSSVYSQPLTISETTTVKAIAVADGEESATATAKYTIGASTSDPNCTTFRLVSSVDDLEPGMRYIIACDSKAKAAGSLSSQVLGSVDVTVSDDVITIGSGVAVFVLEGDQTNGWTFENEDGDGYLYATTTKKLAYSSTENTWTLSNGTAGVVMTYGDYGTMLYNVSSPRFTTYTSSPSSTMIQANLYMEDSSVTPVTPDPAIVADESLTFSTTVGTPQTLTFEVLTEGLTEDVTLTLTDQNNVFSLGQNSIASTTTEANVSVTFTPSTVGTFTATVTLTSAGAESVTVTLTGTATEQGTTPDPTSGETLLYEGLSGYESSSDAPGALVVSSDYFDYSGWSDLSKVYAGGTSNAYAEGGCLKFGSSSAVGSLTTGSLALTGSGTLTFYLKQYGSDTGKLNVTVTGATADVTQFTPSSDWTLCTVNLTGGTGDVTITFATTTKRAYVDEITLVTGSSSGTEPGGDEKQDIGLQFTDATATATLGEAFTPPTLSANTAAMPTVTYSSSNESVATVDAQTGEVTLLAAGQTVITATFAGDDTYNAATASYTLTVVDPNANDGSADKPYTVAEARALIDAGTGGTNDVCVRGIVTQVNSYNSTYSSITYWISDDGITTNQLQVYSGKGIDGADFTSIDDIQVGDTVVVRGNLKMYSTTYEFDYNNYLVSLVRPESTTPEEPTVDSDYYVKVTSVPNDWSGTYLIVCEDKNVALTGSATTAANIKKPTSVTINNGKIEATSAMDAIAVTIEANTTSGYVLKTASEYYIYNTSSTSNGFSANADLSTAQNYVVTLGITESGDADITAAGSYLRYNTGNTIFNYYKAATYENQTAIQLYKKVEATAVSGDVDGNNEVDQTDLNLLVNLLLGKAQGSDNYNADVDGDGSVSLKDITTLVNIIRELNNAE